LINERTKIMSKITIDDSRGVVEEEGSGLQINSSISMNSLPTVIVSLKTNPGTITRAGVYDLNYDVATTWIMPLASSVPGGVFVFRTSDGSAHNLTGSQEASGTKVFAGMAGATPNNQGSKLTLETGTNKSVSLISDGRSFLVMAASGSCTISGI
jgi:hypothetical protein